jgi:signal peptidase II
MARVKPARWALAAAVRAGHRLDQWTKAWAPRRCRRARGAGDRRPAELDRTYNYGAAFSFLSRCRRLAALVLPARSPSASACCWWMAEPHAAQRLAPGLPLALVIGGAIGNLIDRVRHGHVVDFIEWHCWQALAGFQHRRLRPSWSDRPGSASPVRAVLRQAQLKDAA